MRCSTLLAILTGVLLYLVLGAVVFRALEAHQEEDKYIQMQDLRRNFLLNFTCIGPENLQSLIEVAKRLFDFLYKQVTRNILGTFTCLFFTLSLQCSGCNIISNKSSISSSGVLVGVRHITDMS